MPVATVSIAIKKSKNYSVSAIYCPPRYNPKLEDYIKLLKLLGCNFIIRGDFNAKTYSEDQIELLPKEESYLKQVKY